MTCNNNKRLEEDWRGRNAVLLGGMFGFCPNGQLTALQKHWQNRRGFAEKNKRAFSELLVDASG